MNQPSSTYQTPPVKDIQKYYRLHAPLYDATRWSFLFGRKSLIHRLPRLQATPEPEIAEIGCGTGRNLSTLRRKYPQAHITGIDFSGAMLAKAGDKSGQDPKVQLVQAAYGDNSHDMPSCDLVLLSYSLTISSNNVGSLLQQVSQDLAPGGYIAVVDFHKTPLDSFRRWMHFNNVSLVGTLLPRLKHYFTPVETDVKQAYLGLWSYFQFVGQKKYG